MSVNYKKGVDIVLSFGFENDQAVKEHLQSKPSHRRVEVIRPNFDDLNKAPDPNGKIEQLFAQVDEYSRIIIIGHSSGKGSTLQFDPPKNRNVPISQLTHHFSVVADYIAQRITKARFNTPEHTLTISLRSCYGGYGECQSLAAKMQRLLAVAYQIYSNITARTELVYNGKPTYTMGTIEYGLRFIKQNALEKLNRVPLDERKSFYSGTPEIQLSHHQRPGSKIEFYWNDEGEQWMRNSYILSKEHIQNLRIFAADCKNIYCNNELKNIVDKLEEELETLNSHSSNIQPILKELKNCLKKMQPEESYKDLISRADEFLSQYEKLEEKCLAKPVSTTERTDYRTHSELIDEKLLPLESILISLVFDTSLPVNSSFYTAFFDLKNGILQQIRNYYAYQLKYELKTNHIDDLIKELESFLMTVAMHPNDLEKILSKNNPVFKQLRKKINKLSEGGSFEGVQRAARRGISGIPHASPFITVCNKKRTELRESLNNQLDLLKTEIEGV